jgi:hypothetical protein
VTRGTAERFVGGPGSVKDIMLVDVALNPDTFLEKIAIE